MSAVGSQLMLAEAGPSGLGMRRRGRRRGLTHRGGSSSLDYCLLLGFLAGGLLSVICLVLVFLPDVNLLLYRPVPCWPLNTTFYGNYTCHSCPMSSLQLLDPGPAPGVHPPPRGITNSRDHRQIPWQPPGSVSHPNDTSHATRPEGHKYANLPAASLDIQGQNGSEEYLTTAAKLAEIGGGFPGGSQGSIVSGTTRDAPEANGRHPNEIWNSSRDTENGPTAGYLKESGRDGRYLLGKLSSAGNRSEEDSLWPVNITGTEYTDVRVLNSTSQASISNVSSRTSSNSRRPTPAVTTARVADFPDPMADPSPPPPPSPSYNSPAPDGSPNEPRSEKPVSAGSATPANEAVIEVSYAVTNSSSEASHYLPSDSGNSPGSGHPGRRSGEATAAAPGSPGPSADHHYYHWPDDYRPGGYDDDGDSGDVSDVGADYEDYEAGEWPGEPCPTFPCVLLMVSYLSPRNETREAPLYADIITKEHYPDVSCSVPRPYLTSAASAPLGSVCNIAHTMALIRGQRCNRLST